MRQTAGLVMDMMTLARLHAALDSVVEARQLITNVGEAVPRPALEQVGELFDQARDLLRAILTPDARQAVGTTRS